MVTFCFYDFFYLTLFNVEAAGLFFVFCSTAATTSLDCFNAVLI